MTTGLKPSALLSRQAVQIMKREQDFNINKFQSLLNDQPIIDYKTGLQETVKWKKTLKQNIRAQTPHFIGLYVIS